MTLPFRRRHHDAEAGHDRARQLWSISMVEPLDERDGSWLDSHLEGCTECRLERDSQLADQRLLRSLRDRPIDPPRDLWARTAAAIEREAARGSRAGRSLPVANLVSARARLPLGVLSGVLVVLVVVAVSFAPSTPLPPTAFATPSGGVSNPTPVAGSSPLAVAAAGVTYVQTGPDGSIRIIHADVDEVCPTEKTGCAPLRQQTQSSLVLGAPPQALVASPESDELVVVQGRDGSRAGSVIVVPVPTPLASGAPETSAASVAPTSTTAPTAPSTNPTSGPGGSQGPTPVPTPAGAHSIAEGVVVVGETRYSPDGRWLAFSAAPLDGSNGPDLYLWNGTDAAAVRVTTDHATYFSSWLGDRLLASRLLDATGAPVASPGSSSATASAAASADASTSAVELHPSSFLLDPATLATQDLAAPDVWLPTVDPSKRFVTYWAGTVARDAGTVELGTGHLVLDGWLAPIDAAAPGGGASPSAAGNGHSSAPAASSAPAGSRAPVGPAGTPVELAAGPITAFEARFDPDGKRLAVWVADASDPTVGTLRLVVLDRDHGRIDARPSPLPSVRALKGVSMDAGRLAWVTPPGQDGNQSTVQVLAWSNDEFGQVQTVPGVQLTIVR
jgi:hypothetical protein